MSIILCCKIVFCDSSFINITNAVENIFFLSEIYNFGVADSHNYQKELLLLNHDLYKNKVFNNSDIFLYFFDHDYIDNYIFYKKKIVNIEWNDKIYFRIFFDNAIEIYNKIIADNITVKCKAKFCDNRCGLSIKKYTFQGKVAHIINKFSCFKVDKKYNDDIFNGGKLIFISGNNKKCELLIDYNNNNSIVLFSVPDQPIKIGDEFNIIQSCDRMISTCNNVFINKINFQGESYIT